MRWISPKQTREVIREAMGWNISPKTLRTWVLEGKLRQYSPGRKQVFYPIEDVANLLRMEPSQIEAIVKKEKGGRP
jgi:predicted site-specific integrase-resolvase